MQRIAGRSRPKASPMALNTSSAVAESPPSSKKLSSGPIEGSCSTRCQILASTSIVAEADVFFRTLIVVWKLQPARTRAFPLEQEARRENLFIGNGRISSKAPAPWCIAGQAPVGGRRCGLPAQPWNSYRSRRFRRLPESRDK